MRRKILCIIISAIIVVNIFTTIIPCINQQNVSASGRIGLANSPWPMYRYDLRHTGQSPYNTSTNPGKMKWYFPTQDLITSSASIGSDGSIYIGSEDSNLYAINPDGTLKWSFKTKRSILSSPAIGSDSTIYVGSFDHKLYAINSDGTEKWNFTTGGPIEESSPAIGIDGTIYIGSWDGKLYAINQNGTEKWHFATYGQIHSSPAIGDDGAIYIGSWDGKLYAINPDGTLKWSYTIGFSWWSSPAIGSDGTVYFGTFDHKLYAINPDGTQKWSFTTGDRICSSPAISSDGTIYQASYDGKLYAINPDGTKNWSFQTGAIIESSPAISSDGMIFVGSWGHKLYAIDHDGTERWNFTKGGRPFHSSPCIGPEGTVYIGLDWNLYAIGNTTPIVKNIDIDPNTLNLKSKGNWITCYITLNEPYDPSSIDISTILLEDTIPAEWGDIQGDRLMVKFDRSAVQALLPVGTYNLKVTGELADGTSFEGYSDEIRVIDPGK